MKELVERKVEIMLSEFDCKLLMMVIEDGASETDEDILDLVELQRKLIHAFATAGIDTDAVLRYVTGRQ